VPPEFWKVMPPIWIEPGSSMKVSGVNAPLCRPATEVMSLNV